MHLGRSLWGSLRGDGGRDREGLKDPGSSLSSLTVGVREGDSSSTLSRRVSVGVDSGTEHFPRPVGPGCPFVDNLHFLQFRPPAGTGVATCICSSAFLSARVVEAAMSSFLWARGAFTVGGGRASPPSTSVSSCRRSISMRPSRLLSFRRMALGPRLLVLLTGGRG